MIDRHSGEIRQAQVFVAVLGASSYTFAEATWSQQLPDWLGSHARCFDFLGRVPGIEVTDNLCSTVNKTHRYEPDIVGADGKLTHPCRLKFDPGRVADFCISNCG